MICKLLIVDDNADCADSLAELLGLYKKYEIRTAYDPDTAIVLAREFEPDIIISDLVMPGRNGHDLCEEVKTICPHCEAIIVTGMGSAATTAQTVERGFHHITKPGDPDQFELLVHEKCQIVHGRKQCS